MKIVLIGFMGSGKSSVAKQLGVRLNLPVLEMDDIVLEKTNTKSMHEVFACGGEPLLRQTEMQIAQEYAAEDKRIVSTGAGVVLSKKTVESLKKTNARLFFLNATFKTVAHRLIDDASRPLFRNPLDAEKLYHFRQPLYFKYADHVIEVDTKTVEQITEEIIEKVNNHRGIIS